jgi:hypothetical membrane protein
MLFRNPMLASRKMLKIAGLCGIAAPVVAISFIFLAVSLSPWFSWSANALSDLGVREAAWIFNSGLIAAGILSIIFAAGLYANLRERVIGRAGAMLLLISSFALFGIGVFSEAAGAIHTYFSAAFFVLFPLSLFLLGGGAIVAGSWKLGLFTVAAGVVAAIPWAFRWNGVAIPELISALAASSWSMVRGVMLYFEQAKE